RWRRRSRSERMLGRLPITPVPPARHLLRAKDLADARYFEPLGVPDLARAARLSPAHFSREFRREFGESPHQYLLTRRLERAAALLRRTDWTVTEICLAVGLTSLGSSTTRTRPSPSGRRRSAWKSARTSPFPSSATSGGCPSAPRASPTSPSS